MDQDVLGTAIRNYYFQDDPTDIEVLSPTMEDDVLPVSYLFRSIDDMPKIERKALSLSSGSVLEVGCAAGCHTAVLLSRSLPVTAIDISAGAIDVVKNRFNFDHLMVMQQSVWDHKGTYDTILMLMNGTGIMQSLNKLTDYLRRLKALLSENGQILIDSSDLKFLYEDDEDGGLWIPAGIDYYGEVSFQFKYKNLISDPFPWLYCDFKTLKEHAQKAGFSCIKVMDGDHYDYLAQLSIS
ncbi:class I SAM-dependent methyltransferase [Nonlabens sp. SY33080]|uniref:class I SAM-dependent methyltransferase n=1 Tax=Nonlabens sp. SY33080 TaxID=2719911 RepID=UPI001428A131|nr:methyltransferase domain-containing protein [Nonlabens sp. SY33080]